LARFAAALLRSADVPDLAGPHRIGGLKEFNNDGQQSCHPVRRGVDHHHAEGEIGEVLKVLDVFLMMAWIRVLNAPS
jgi:hypothetical protein